MRPLTWPSIATEKIFAGWRGDLRNFTCIDSPYEAPERPEIRIDTTVTAPEDAAELIVAHLRAMRILR